MPDTIPEDVIEFTRGVFETANVRATTALARQPAAHEEMLDFQVFAALDEVGPCILGSGIAIDIDTHWLGGRRHYGGRWEIADIGIVIVLRRGGRCSGARSACFNQSGCIRVRFPLLKWSLPTTALEWEGS